MTDSEELKGKQGSGQTEVTKKKASATAKKTASTGDGGKYIPRMQEKLRDVVTPQLIKEFRYTSIMQAPRLVKIVLNIGIGAEAILEILKSIDLESERNNLIKSIKETKSKVSEDRSIKR